MRDQRGQDLIRNDETEYESPAAVFQIEHQVQRGVYQNFEQEMWTRYVFEPICDRYTMGVVRNIA